ncbi:uncharacterized protein THITE_2108835 [Thermothielavioides terrestris NRRL 8126]|uniref:Uncharacterized protein n=1 Tax=Thermothielavioides terrestris (strain ATCC 38088 / NRRL 8126) TaxID=578455 RepID=G2QSK5_THETT|nr:uncharacterized protein THITE_2108835 [Thermothielavioides terrestris NRRL 8126]AEO63487.1 hypothetical protein THITE_2108835 [Thermothielavioides terrestris NRRL 8126]
MPSLYTITEPHPTVPQNSYTHSGRGGLGNFFRAPATTSPAGVPTPASSTTAASTRRFYSGRGGAGNAHAAGPRPVLSFDEEFTRAEVRDKTATTSHYGRGGAGNIISTSGGGEGDGDSLSRHDSASSAGSTGSRRSFWGRITSVGH